MSKKSKSTKHKKKLTVGPSQADKQLDLISEQLYEENYAEAAANCERLLNYLPSYAPKRADVLAQLGTALAMLQNFPQSYDAFTEALSLDPNNADLWYNHGTASRYTSRFGRSLRDLERAAELNTSRELAPLIKDELELSRKLAKDSIQLRGPDFTLDQLIEQEEHFQNGMKLMETGKWNEAEQALKAAIAMGDCLPQPWGNLGMCLMMQERYDEAEAALKRALVIDPHYAIARRNLALLPETRRTGPPKAFEIRDPFKNSGIEQSITFISE